MAGTVTSRRFGAMPDGREVRLYKLVNAQGMMVEISDLGGTIVTMHAPDRDGRLADVTLGFDSAEPYLGTGPYFGSIVGRCANRIGGARFELNGVEYRLADLGDGNHLHGGIEGFDKKLWQAQTSTADGAPSLRLAYESQDGEEGYPGNLSVTVTYTLTDDGGLSIGYEAVTDRDTVVNLTNHAYFNLAGHDAGNIEGHEMMIDADRFTPMNEQFITTGELRGVEGTPLDFRTRKPVGPGLHSDYEQIRIGGGYDHNWALNGEPGRLRKAAEVFEPGSGRVLEVFTTKPGVQFYAGNFLDGTVVGKGGAVYVKRGGLCLETQHYPNAVNCPHFPSPVLRAGDTYAHTTIFKCSVR